MKERVNLTVHSRNSRDSAEVTTKDGSIYPLYFGDTKGLLDIVQTIGPKMR